MSFEWRTDEDDGWQEAVKPAETAVAQPFWRRRWRFLLVALLGIAAVWGVVQWQVDQRIDQATQSLESDLLATHNFLLQTAVSRDEALFKANLSGRDPDWGATQKSLLEEGLFLDRPMLGWYHQAMAEPLTLEDVTFELSPDLQAAEMQYPQTYVVQSQAGITETVRLWQTAVYRQGRSRWLYAPPLEDFWGEWHVWPGEHLTVAYTERDADIAERLATDLDGLLGQMCAELEDLNCVGRLRVNLRLDTEPLGIIKINDIETMLTAGPRLSLPTPTLIGLPRDESSYEALYRAYGVQLATAVLAHQIEYDCCTHQLFFRALRDYQFAQLGLQAWPLKEEMFAQMLQAGFDGSALSHWTRRWEEAPPQFLQVWLIEDPEPIWQQVYMLIEFMNTQETAVSPAQMMRLMNRNSHVGWLEDTLGDGYDSAFFQTQFIDYIYDQSHSGQLADLPIPLPSGKITLICEGENSAPNYKVFTYDLATETWAELFANQFEDAFITTSDGIHFVVTEYDGFDSQEPAFSSRYLLATEESVELLEEVAINRTPKGVGVRCSYFSLDQRSNFLVRYEYDSNNEHTTTTVRHEVSAELVPAQS
ncbi:MAG: hypothetical protein H6656_13645 [Ardenticatenaceae bacterium]|nr:hypothetical protein [Ardenticatenaceae bacterium]